MKNKTPLIFGGILILFHTQAMAEPLGLDWFTAAGTGTGVYQDGPFFVDGLKYFGGTIGAENSDFYQRYVVRIGGAGAALGAASNYINELCSEGCEASHSGGVPGSSDSQPHCATIAPGSSSVCIPDLAQQGNRGLGFDPLGLFSAAAGGRITVEDSGNGTNDPTTAVVRMIVKDSTFIQEFLKDSLNYKPRITATLTTPELVSTVSMDMRAIDYNTLNANTPFVNTLTFTNPAESAANFNQATDAQNSNVTAGQFIYLPQGGWSSQFAPVGTYQAGLYLHADGGGFNMFDNSVYGFYWDPDQNGGPLVLPPCASTNTCVLPYFAQD